MRQYEKGKEEGTGRSVSVAGAAQRLLKRAGSSQASPPARLNRARHLHAVGMAPRIGLTAVALLAALHGGLGAPRAAARGTATATAGTTATAAATGLAASFAPAFDGWQQLGATLSRDEQVVAISMDFSADPGSLAIG